MSLDTYPSAQVDAMQARITELERENKDLRDRFAEVDTVKNAALNCVREATGAVLRLAPLEADARQAREDEAWACKNRVVIRVRDHGFQVNDYPNAAESFSDSFHTSLRALREKVEGGAR